MRHRTYKQEHLPASLRPTVAAAMVRLAELRPGQVVLDPMCGAGTILAEQLAVCQSARRAVVCWAATSSAGRCAAAAANLRRLGPVRLAPLGRDAGCRCRTQCVDRVVVQPAVRQAAEPRRRRSARCIGRCSASHDRVLRPAGSAVLLVSELRASGRRPRRRLETEQVYSVRILGQPAAISVWRKPGG